MLGIITHEEQERRDQAASPVIFVDDTLIQRQLALLPAPPYGPHDGPLPPELDQTLAVALELGLLQNRQELEMQHVHLQQGIFDKRFYSRLRRRRLDHIKSQEPLPTDLEV